MQEDNGYYWFNGFMWGTLGASILWFLGIAATQPGNGAAYRESNITKCLKNPEWCEIEENRLYEVLYENKEGEE